MNERDQNLYDGRSGGTEGPVSRRVAVGVSGLTLLGLLAGSAPGQEEPLTETQKESIEKGRQRVQEGMRQGMDAYLKQQREKMPPEDRAFWEQMDKTRNMEERQKISRDWHVRMTQTRVNKELGVSAEEWAVIQPRLLAVINLDRATSGVGDTPVALLVLNGYNELRLLLQNKEAKPEEIKAKLTSLCTAKEQARRELAKAQRDLRQLMNLRQEAVLVLNGLLD